MNFLLWTGLILRGMAAYLLGLTMLVYGMTKILKTQFVLLPFHAWDLPLREVSGRQLTWVFLGYSGWFSVLLGFLEFIPAILLIFQRTRLLGALLLLPVTLNIFLFNIALELWQSTQVVSGVLLILNLGLLAADWKKLKSAWLTIQPSVPPNASRFWLKLEFSVNLILVAGISGLLLTRLSAYLSERNFLSGDWRNARPNVWILETSDAAGLTQGSRIYFQPYQVAWIHRASDERPLYHRYSLSESLHKLTVSEPDGKTPFLIGRYTRVDQDRLDWHLTSGEKLTLRRQQLSPKSAKSPW